MSTTAPDIVLTEEAKRTIRIAQAYAKENMNAQFTAAHLLKALVHKDAGLLPSLKALNKDIYYIEEWAEVRIESLPKASSVKESIQGDASVEETMAEADNIRIKLGKDAIEPLHALISLSTPGIAFSYDQLKTLPLRREELLQEITEKQEIQSALSQQPNGQTPAAGGNQALLKFCVDKLLAVKEGKADAIVGRDKETRMMAEILCRRSKPNVIITGEPGVGKSALVDGFVYAIHEQKVPQQLLNARVFELDTGALIAGASYKGEIEDRLKNIIAAIKAYDKAILFIDEIHVLIDKNGAAGGAVSLLKPELARGELTVIGATTREEYRKYIETDEAFSRRFEMLNVDEPDASACFHMISTVIPRYEKHHQIKVEPDTIRESIRLSKRYIKERRLPDAAIDLLDRSMAALGMINSTAVRELDEFEQALGKLAQDNNESLESLQWLAAQMKDKLSPILWAHFQSEDDPALMQDAAKVKEYILQSLAALRQAAGVKHETLEKPDISAIVSYKTGIPIGKVQTQEKERLLNMESIIRQRVIGQDQAVKTIADAILESRSGLSRAGQPIGSFFFLGPTGTGKTELAKALASFLFQDESFMIRFDMSEFKEENAAALLYGASPGYVGYEEGGLLVNKIREKPYSIVLFDEIEKAHQSVFDIFLQILDEGKLHDKLGKEGDFSNAVVIFTSNIGSQYVVDAFGRGETPSGTALMEIMGQYFRPEFLGRLTEIIPFAPMNLSMVQNILRNQLKSVYESLDRQGIRLKISEPAATELARLGFTPKYGARPLAGVIRSQVKRPLSRKIINGDIGKGSVVELRLDETGGFQWEVQAAAD